MHCRKSHPDKAYDMSVIDKAVFGELRATVGDDFVKELVQTFLDDAPALLAALHDANARGDAPAFRRAAHSLKSNGHTFGATSLAAQARDLEQQGLDGLGGAAGARIDELERSLVQAGAALQELAHV